ncbi:hypothetical protein [Nocardia salmonicida]|uniref:hypothetical protein n=1 Tax=Nocardia salmonicida TaxID=53431 RepID=UPI002E2D34F8|nr:hypothetical protein [Nocardia salmonicida]
MSTDHGQEPIHDPVDLLGELDSIIREQAMLEARTTALRARYTALQPFVDRYDEPGDGPYSSLKEHGSINVKYAALYLDDAVSHMQGAATYGLNHAREMAQKVREYPQPAAARVPGDRPDVDRRRSR